MWFILLCLFLPSYLLYSLPSLLHTYPPEVYHVLYGDLSMDDLYLPELTDENLTDSEMKNISQMDIRVLLRDPYTIDNSPDTNYQGIQNITVNGQDAKEYNDISTIMVNYTRKRVFSQYWGKVDYDDWYWNSESIELKKMKMFEKISLMYLYHSRYKIALAFKQRDPMRNDKRYKLGYLFNRLRRLKTEMLKFVAIAKRQKVFYWNEYQNMTSLMRLYERVVHYDVDIRDTTGLIKEIYNKEESYDVYTTKKSATGDSNVRPEMAGGSGGPENQDKKKSSLADDYTQDLEKHMTG